jgi:hypothetical protein
MEQGRLNTTLFRPQIRPRLKLMLLLLKGRKDVEAFQAPLRREEIACAG